MRVIKRYQNRKLYDVKTHRYTSLGEIYNLVKFGTKVQVLDRNQTDVTNIILLRALTECGDLELNTTEELIKTHGKAYPF